MHMLRSDCQPRCTMVVHSICGGTGAGLGSRLLEEVRDEAGKAYVVSVSVLPMAAGEKIAVIHI